MALELEVGKMLDQKSHLSQILGFAFLGSYHCKEKNTL